MTTPNAAAREYAQKFQYVRTFAAEDWLAGYAAATAESAAKIAALLEVMRNISACNENGCTTCVRIASAAIAAQEGT